MLIEGSGRIRGVAIGRHAGRCRHQPSRARHWAGALVRRRCDHRLVVMRSGAAPATANGRRTGGR